MSTFSYPLGHEFGATQAENYRGPQRRSRVGGMVLRMAEISEGLHNRIAAMTAKVGALAMKLFSRGDEYVRFSPLNSIPDTVEVIEIPPTPNPNTKYEADVSFPAGWQAPEATSYLRHETFQPDEEEPTWDIPLNSTSTETQEDPTVDLSGVTELFTPADYADMVVGSLTYFEQNSKKFSDEKRSPQDITRHALSTMAFRQTGWFGTPYTPRHQAKNETTDSFAA